MLISVVVLSYNHEKFIERCLRSVTSQNFTDFEIIYIDNNSDDRSFEKGLEVLKRSKIKFYAEKTTENLGAGKGTNYGIAHATGYYISPLSGDDWWDIEHLSYKMDYFSAHPEYGMIYGNGYNYNDNTQEITLFYNKPNISGWIFKDLLQGPIINPEGIIYNHELMKKVGFYDPSAKVEDRDLWLRMAKVSQIGYVDKALTFYRVNHGNNISSDLEHMREGNEYFFKKYEKEYPKEIKIARLGQYQYFAYSLATNNPTMKSLKSLLKNYQFDWVYNKQVLKCLINMVKS